MKSNIKIFLSLIAIILVVALGAIYLVGRNKPDSLSAISGLGEGTVAGETTIIDNDYVSRLAKHLSDKGMVLFGSYQCPQCKAQKELFGDSSKYLDYVECDASGPSAYPDECLAQKIDSYPTWVFEGKQYKGFLELSELARVSNFSE